MIIKVSQNVMEEIFDQAIEEYPAECCGWIIQDKSGNQVYTRAKNLQDKYHQLDPESYPRTSHDAFLMDSLKLNKAVEEAREQGGELFSIVHSHIDCGAYFSMEDEKQMSMQDSSGQVFPSHCYIVVSVEKKQPYQTAVFVFDEDSKKFLKARLEIV
jgi:proteasome lid subunit RPN8/RPN11